MRLSTRDENLIVLTVLGINLVAAGLGCLIGFLIFGTPS